MIEPSIRAILVADVAVNAASGGRIRPTQAAQDDSYPRVVYQITSDSPNDCLDAEASHSTVGFQVDVYAVTLLSARSLALLVQNALHYYGGTIGGFNIANIKHEGTADLTPPAEDGEEQPTYRMSLDFSALVLF